MAPEGCFIPAESVECIVGQIGETQKAMREFGVGIDRFRPGIGQRFRSARVAMRLRNGIETARVNLPEHRIDNFPRLRLDLSRVLELTQMLGLNLE